MSKKRIPKYEVLTEANCPTCGVVKPQLKVFGTLVCPKYSIIIGGKYSID